MKLFKMRASKASKLLTAGGKMSKAKTPKTYAEEWVISQFTGKKKRIESKYLRRGIDAEPQAIKRVGKHFVKNEESFENDFFTGTPDIIPSAEIIDTKVSWDAFTFPWFMKKPPIIYVAQNQVYMNLTGKRKSRLIYCLENGTEEQINRLAWTYANEAEAEEPTIEHWDKAEAELNYDHLPDEARMKVFEIPYNEEMIEEIKKGVLFCRDYIKNDLIPELPC